MSFAPLSIPSPPEDWRTLIDFPLGPFHITIATYAILMLLGMVAAAIWVNHRLKKRGAEPGVVLDVIIWAIPLGIVGARLYHVATHAGDYFYEGAELWKVVAIWEGGNAIFGALIGGAVGAWIGCRFAGLRFWTFADALAPAMLLAQAIGRLGNYVNHELFGQPTDLPWGLEISANNPAFPVGLAEGTLFHPTFLYEILWNVAGIALLLLIERKANPQWGKLWALYMIWYGIGRTWFESIRLDPSDVYFGLRTNVWGAIVIALLGVILYIVQTRRHPGTEPSPYLPGREWMPEGAVDSGETYSDVDEPGDDAGATTESLTQAQSDKLATSGSGKTTS